ncbi:MAG TPA: aldo/keto reductase [Jatrophihabitans sp.]
MTDVSPIVLNNGVEMPRLGFGVWQVPAEATRAAVTEALRVGYRSIDTAAAYRNEAGVGQAIADSGISREELFVTTKLWNNDQGYDSTLRAFDKSVLALGLDHVDLYLIHWPLPARDAYIDTWRAFEKLQADGRIRAIGVSNFLPEHLDRLVNGTQAVPAVNQIEVHPYLQNRDSVAANERLGIATEAWSPLASGRVLDDPTVTEIATAHERTAAQVVLRWHLQKGYVVIPKSVTPARIAQNFTLFDFVLGDDDMTAIDTLERDGRTGPHPATFNLGA